MKSPARILLVEDDNDLREGLADYLRLSGLQVTEANCGMAFHRAVRSEHFDVAILDVNLPDISGFELAASIARDREHMGIIMLTARARHSDRIRGYTEGADLYLTKPVVAEELLLAVRNLVRRIGPSDPSPARPAKLSWKLNLRMRRLSASDGSSIDLTGREVLLVEQFAGLEGKPIPRHVLSDALRYGAANAESRGLDAALRRFRQKIIEAGLEPPLVSIQNIGIRFTDPLELA